MKHQSSKWIKLRATLESVVQALLYGSLVVAALCCFYVLSGVIGGVLLRLQPGDVQAATDKVSYATQTMMVAAVLASLISLFGMSEAANPTPVIVGAVGLFFWFGGPAIIGYCEGGRGFHSNEALVVLRHNFVRAGQAVLITLIWPALRWAVTQIKLKPAKKSSDEYLKSSGVARLAPVVKPTVLSPCWKLPYCRDFLLQVCPAYKAKRRCWKFGRGCFCDDSMIENMIAGVKRQQRGYVRSEIDARTGIASQRKKKPPCKRCFIYLEHQELKYTALSPLVYPASAAIIYFAWGPVVQGGWGLAQGYLWKIWTSLAFTAQSAAAASAPDEFGQTAMATMFGILLAMGVVLGLLRFVETWCFKWKL